MSTIATPKLQPCLWFNFDAEEAVDFWLSVFKDGKVLHTSRYPDAMPGAAGKVMVIEFELAGQRMQALNAGPQFPFTEAISLSVDCADQAEVDELWAKLTADGGQESMCGWLKDKFGMNWQIVPRGMGELVGSPDPARASRARQAMMTMRKLDIAAIRRAADAA